VKNIELRTGRFGVFFLEPFYQPMVVVVDLGPGGLDSWDSLMKKKYVT